MNLTKLFETQRELDAKILLQKGLGGQNLLDKKILALQVELGELANEWQMFKFWKEDREPITEYRLKCPNGCYYGEIRSLKGVSCCDKCGGDGYITTNPLLEEYVDCLHFILSIGLELDPEIGACAVEPHIYDEESITNQFIELNYQAYLVIKDYEYKKYVIGAWFTLLDLFAGLGQMLGFTWEQIEQAYFAKNKINFERQANGY